MIMSKLKWADVAVVLASLKLPKRKWAVERRGTFCGQCRNGNGPRGAKLGELPKREWAEEGNATGVAETVMGRGAQS